MSNFDSPFNDYVIPRTSPPRDVIRFLNLCQNPQNAAIIKAELNALDGRSPADRGIVGPPVELLMDEPCPFLTHVLYIAQSEARGPAHMESAQANNLWWRYVMFLMNQRVSLEPTCR